MWVLMIAHCTAPETWWGGGCRSSKQAHSDVGGQPFGAGMEGGHEGLVCALTPPPHSMTPPPPPDDCMRHERWNQEEEA